MAELIGRASDDASEEPTVADDEAYDGLPVGESLDQAAERMRASRNPEPTPITRNPDATPIMRNPDLVAPPPGTAEDPAALALRIAQQAQAQAQALVAQALAQVKPNEEPATGVMQIPSWRGGGAAAMAAVAPAVAPDAAATAPGSPELAAAVSARVGVVPEEPENEPTKKRREETEATAASDVGPDSNPLLAAQQRTLDHDDETAPGLADPMGGAMPQAPVSEMTPSISARHSPFVPEEPPHEVTIRKTGAPAPLPKAPAYVPRTGTGPAGIGALGIRVTVSQRAVVRPMFNGRPSALPSPVAETQISGLHSIVNERPSASTPSAPWQSSEKPRRSVAFVIPKWAFFAAGGGVAAIIGAVVITQFTGGPDSPTPLPTLAATATPLDTEAILDGTPAQTAVAAVTSYPMPTLAVRTATPTATPFATATSLAARTPTPMPTATIARTPTPFGTTLASIKTPTPAPTPKIDKTTQALNDAKILAVKKEYDDALRILLTARLGGAKGEELSYQIWRYSKHSPVEPRDKTVDRARDYIEKYPSANGERVREIRDWLGGP